MKYALGNMLNGAGGLNADGLSLDLQFATDKTLTARKGPTPVFTRASTATFVGSDGLIQSAGNNIARFDHDPVTLACKGLLIEESRTNLLQRSEELDNAYWTKTATTVGGAGTSPSGGSSADVITASVGAGRHIVFREFTGTAVPYTFSLFIKKGTNSFAQLQLALSPANSFGIIVDLNTGLVTDTKSVGATSPSSSVIALSNGWYRVSITATLSAAQWFSVIALSNAAVPTYDVTNNPSFIALGTETIFAWGAQLEAGSFATSYIPTTAASVVRSADVCSITAGDFSGFYNQAEGTLFADATPQTVDQNSFVFGVNTTSFNSSHGIYKINATVSAAGKRWVGTTINATVQAEIVTSTDVAVSKSRLAYAYKLNDFAFAANGSLVGTDTSGTVPSPTAIRIGSRDDGRAMNGHLEAVRYYRKRLSNAKLQSFTV